MVTQPGRRSAVALLILALLFIAFFTLRPAEAVFTVPTYCIVCGPLGGVDFLLNIVLFVPLGMSVRWLSGSFGRSAITGVIVTLLIETLQWRFIPGRDASLGDLIANTLGASIGALLAVHGVEWMNSAGRVAMRRAGAVAVAATWIVVFTGALLRPEGTRWNPFVQWTPLRPNMDPFRGTLSSVRLNGREIHLGEMILSQRTYDTAAQAITVEAVLREPVPMSNRQAIVVRIANEREEGFMLAQQGETAVFRSRIAAVRLKLRPVAVGLDRGFAATDSESGSEGEFTIKATSNPRAMKVVREQHVGSIEVTLARTIGLGWAMILPWDVALTPRWWPANAAWLAVLVLPITFLSMRSSHYEEEVARQLFWWPVTLVPVALVLTSLGFGMSLPTPAEWGGVLAGVVSGVVLERMSQTRNVGIPTPSTAPRSA